MGYTKQAFFGFSGQTVLKIASSLLALVKIYILTKLLTPQDFGVFSLVTIALGVTESFTQTGVNHTILQSKQSVAYFVDTAWVIAILRGLIISIIMIGIGWGMSWYFEPQLLYLIAVASLVPVIKGFINPAIVGLHKEFHFLADSAYRFALVVMDVVLAVTLVYFYPATISWIGALIGTALFEVVISFVFLTTRPQFRYLSNRAQLIFQNSRGLGLSSLMGYLNENMDNLLIGGLLGTFNLGIYQPTYGFSHEPNFEVVKSVHHGTLPVYIKIKDDLPRLRRAFKKTFYSSLLLVILLSTPLLFTPRLFVTLVLGEQWLAAVPLVRWLAVAGIFQSISMLGYSLFLAKNALRTMNVHLMVTFGLMVLFIVIGSQWGGLTGAVMGLALSRLCALPLVLWGIIRQLQSSPYDQ